MYQSEYYIPKQNGFYQDLLETYGLARLLDNIINQGKQLKSDITISSFPNYYKIDLEEVPNENLVKVYADKGNLDIEYIFKDTKKGTAKPKKIGTNEDLNITVFDIAKEWDIVKNYDKSIDDEGQKKPHPYFDIYTLLSHFGVEFTAKESVAGTKQGGMFTRTYLQLYYNKAYLKKFINGLLHNYSSFNNAILSSYGKEIFTKKNKFTVLSKNHKPNETVISQLFHPNYSQGLNAKKLSLSESKKKPDLLKEYLKILGLFDSTFYLGGSKKMDDYRIYVIDPKKISLSQKKNILKKFKTDFFTDSTVKGDILTLLIYSKHLIEHQEDNEGFDFDFDWQPSDYVSGFYICHFMTTKKSPPKKHSPINLAYIQFPEFISISNTLDLDEWKDIITELITITKNIKGNRTNEEGSDAALGLRYLRDFLSSSNTEPFFDFNFWYATYLMFAYHRKIGGENTLFIKRFSKITLNKIFKSMKDSSSSLSHIINNEGFQKIATAIRKSTIQPQMNKARGKKPLYEIRYGLAQKMKNKSNSESEFTSFISDFIADYCSENSMKKEKFLKNETTDLRNDVSKSDLDKFYKLFDGTKETTKRIAAMLAAYGFSTDK